MNFYRAKIAFAFSLFLFPGSVFAADRQTTQPVVLGYYPSWADDHSSATIDYSPFTHLCHAFIIPKADGSLRMIGDMPNRKLCETAHAKGVKVLVSLGGADSNESFSSVTAQKNTRDQFVKNVMDVVKTCGYDGVDLDWEVPRTTATMNALTDLAASFRKELDQLPGERKTITAALSGTPWAMSFVDGRALLPYVDFINVMVYDVHGRWNDHGGHNAPLFHNDKSDISDCKIACGEAMIASLRDKYGWPANRLVLGIPLYGREFACSKPGDKIDKKLSVQEYIPLRSIPDYLSKGWIRHDDSVAGVPWLSSPNGKTFVSYEDKASACAKGQWAAQHGLRGVMFWEITQDAANLPVVKAARDGLIGK